MPRIISTAALLACAFTFTVAAQAPQSAVTTPAAANRIRLQYGSFDPLAHLPEVPAALRGTAQQGLWIVQFTGSPTQASRDAISKLGGQVVGYLPDNAYIVRLHGDQATAVRDVAAVRWVGGYEPAFRLEPALLANQVYAQPAAVRYNVVVADKHKDKPALIAKVQAIGGRVDNEQVGSLLLEVTLTGPQLLQVADFDEVLWIDRWTPVGIDMDNARIQGGANYVEQQAGYTGAGVNVHIYEGIEATHQDFTGGATNLLSGGGSDTHGHCTAGIVFGNGTSNPAVRGMAPDCSKFYTNYNTVTGGYSRWQVVSDLVNIYNISHTTASWGNAQTTAYTSISADADDIIFDHDIAWTQSQSNLGNQNSRPQAWAKNIFSIGGVEHYDNSNPLDDSWAGGGASTGPAADGRIKPTLCAYYDSIGTSDLTGAAGYSSGNWYASFGGTSGATPICAGHNVLAIQMFTDDSATPGIGRFGNVLRNPGGSVHSNRPHFTTLKALEVASASQYAFTAASTDNRREHQGWGFPSLRTMWDNRSKTFIVDETDVLAAGQTTRWNITVLPGEPALKMCLNYSEPAANPAAAQTLINNLSLRVTAPNGTTYWGNYGLQSGNWSLSGGTEDTINPIECVFVQNPQAGVWYADVLATAVVQDSHVETPAVDADYGFVVSGGTGQPGSTAGFATVAQIGSGCGGSPGCAQAIYEYPTFGLTNAAFTLHYAAGNYTLMPGTGSWIAPAGVNMALGDDTEVNQSLSFSLPFPGGTTSTLHICSNGWITTGSGVSGSNWVPAVASFLANPMWALLWRDLNPSAAGAVWFDSNASRAVVSWAGVPNYSNTGSNTFQAQFWANGDVHVIYQGLTISGDYLAGFSRGGAADPGSITLATNLNAGLGVCGAIVLPVPDVALSASARPIVGTTVSFTTSNVPAGTLLGLSILSGTEINPGFDLTALGMPNCHLYAALDVIDQFPTIGGSGSRSFAFPNNPSLSGALLMNQTATLTPGINAFGFVTSNALRMVIGTN